MAAFGLLSEVAALSLPRPIPLCHRSLLFSYLRITLNHPFPPSESGTNTSTHRTTRLSSPLKKHTSMRPRVSVTVRSQLRYPIISPDDHWGTWSSLFAIGAFGLWSEKTKIGSMVSAALASTLVRLAASNVGILPYDASAYSIVLEFLLPIIIPLLLFRANLNHVLRSTGTLLLAFLLGSVATVVGTLVAFLIIPMRSLGPDNWKIAAALMGSFIGGYDALYMESSDQGNLCCRLLPHLLHPL